MCHRDATHKLSQIFAKYGFEDQCLGQAKAPAEVCRFDFAVRGRANSALRAARACPL